MECQTAGGAAASPVRLSDHAPSPAAAHESHGVTLPAAPLFLCGESPTPGTKKGAIVRKLSRLGDSAVILFEDETILRLFPVLRRAWSLSGEPATVAISGQNTKQVLFGAINMHTGHRIVMLYAALKQSGFQDWELCSGVQRIARVAVYAYVAQPLVYALSTFHRG